MGAFLLAAFAAFPAFDSGGGVKRTFILNPPPYSNGIDIPGTLVPAGISVAAVSLLFAAAGKNRG
jgi:hypothetical protein